MRFARKLLQKGASAQAVADQLVDRALRRYTSDNVAVVVVVFPWSVASSKRAGKRKLFGLL
jgi:serine/threonine protein phosphatase PrpC